MVTVENDALFETYARKQGIKSMPRKHSGERTVYRSHDDLGPLGRDLHNIVPVLADFGEAQYLNKAPVLRRHIQPDSYRAPEVLLGLKLSYSADIWNFGLVVSSKPMSP
jgi:serine/threonine protein kinase